MNFAGIGASIAVKDDGATATLDKVARAFTSLQSGFANAVGRVAGIAGGGELTTPFEDAAQQASVSTRKVVAQMGIFGSALNKVGGQAAGLMMGMKTSAETAGRASGAVHQYGKELKAFGINSAETAVKLEDGLGVDVLKLAKDARQLSKELGLNDKEMNEFSKLLTGAGEAIGDMRGPFQMMPEWMELARNRANLLAQGMSQIGAKETLKSLAGATQHLFALGVDAQTAQKVTIGLEKQMGGAMESFRDMFAGTASDLHPFLTEFSVVSGDIQDAFKSAEQGPDAFILNMAEAVAKLRKQGGNVDKFLTLFAGRMKQTLGKDVADGLVGAIKSVDEQKLKTLKTTKLLEKDLGVAAKDAWRSSMTLQESFNMAMGAGEAGFRDIGRQAAVTFVKDIPKAWGTFNTYAKGLVKEGGALGAIVQKMSEISSLGPKALLPSNWQPAVAVFGKLYDSIMPSLGMITQLGGALTVLANPVTLLALALGGLVALVIKNKKETNSWSDAVVNAAGEAKKFLDEWSQKILKWADNFDWKGVFTALARGMADAMKGLTKVFQSVGSKTTEKIQESIATPPGGGSSKTFTGVAKNIFDQISAAFSDIPWGELLRKMIEAMSSARGSIMKDIQHLVAELFQVNDNKAWEELGKQLVGPFKSVLGIIFEVLKTDAELASEVNSLFETLLIGALKALPSMYIAAFKAFWKDVSATLSTSDVIQDLLFPGAALVSLSKGLGEAEARLIKGVNDMFIAAKDAIIGIWKPLWTPSIIPDLMALGIEEMKTKAMELVGTFISIGDKITGALGGAIGKVTSLFSGGGAPSGAIAGDMDKSTKVVEAATAQMRDYVNKVLFESVTETISKSFMEAFKRILEGTDKFIGKDRGTLVIKFKEFALRIVDTFRTMWTTILDETDLSVKAMTTTISASLSDIKKLELALERLQSTRETMREAESKIDEKQSNYDPLSKAINRPDWYFDGQDSYKDLFKSKMNELKDAIRQGGVSAPASGNAGAAAAAAAALRSSQDRDNRNGNIGASTPGPKR